MQMLHEILASIWTVWAVLVFGLIVGLLKLQPDIGMMAVIVAVFLAQLFVNGLHLVLVGVAAGAVVSIAILPISLFMLWRLRTRAN